MKSRRYAIAAWKLKKPKTFWKDSERREWEEFFKKTVIHSINYFVSVEIECKVRKGVLVQEVLLKILCKKTMFT